MSEYAKKSMSRWGQAVACAAFSALLGLGGIWWWQGRPERYLARAENAFREDDPDEALAWLAVPESVKGTRERAQLLRARIAVEQGRLSEAALALDQVDPNGPSAYDHAYWKGRMHYAARQPIPAITWFVAALKWRPDDADSHRWLAAASYDQGNR
ncbi:MAG TPA: hypothetical protein VHS97_25230, partial [Isosphaeraceae bacterium]|nr:hypothetical protein [Isosphaeraceae bacterium]